MSGGARRGRAGALSLGLIVGFLLVGYAVLRALELSPRFAPGAVESELGRDAPQDLGAWRARVEMGEGDLTAAVDALLLPLHDEPRLQAFRAESLRARYGLPAGQPWRLYLTLDPESALAPQVRGARVLGPGGAVTARPLPEVASAPEGPDPVFTLLAAEVGLLAPDAARTLVLWGAVPDADARLLVEGVVLAGEAALERADPAPVAPRWLGGRALPREERATLESEIARLQDELGRERRRRVEREAAFLELSRMVAELPVGRELGLEPPPAEPPPEPDPAELERLAAEGVARARAEELGRALSVLMRLEGVRGLDLLDPGTLRAGPPAAIGPVVFRCLDERGLLTGSLRAERLRLESSTAAHTLTIVLEDGFESRGGERVPFTGGVRRISLANVDPLPWLEDCPELFAADDLLRANDDGLWDLRAVRHELNRLLALDTELGWFRLHSLGGVRGEALMDVQLEELEPSGRLVRRLFADRLFVTLEDGSVALELEDGAYVRGGEKRPFRDGRHRVVLPGADAADWLGAPLPGFSDPPATPPREEDVEDDTAAAGDGGR